MDMELATRMLDQVAMVPAGAVATYGDIAARAGSRSPRLAGRVLSELSDASTPWHRILRADGTPAAHLATDLGRAAFTLIPRGVPSVLVGALTVGLVLPTSALPYLLGAVSIVLAVTLSFLCRYAVNLAGFWLVETRGVTNLFTVTYGFLSGLYVPVHLFPDWLGAVAAATPFPSILQSPIDVLSGRVVGVDALRVVLVQLAWVAGVAVLGQALTRAGRLKLEVQGG